MYTFIKTPESESDLEHILDELSEISMHSTITFSNNFKKTKQSKQISTISCNSKKKKHNVIFDLNSQNILFSDITGCCIDSYYHYTLNELLTEQISIIGCALKKSSYWIYNMIISTLKIRNVKSIQTREFLKSKHNTLKQFVKKQIIDEIIDKEIYSLKKPTCWKFKLFENYINNYFNMKKRIKIGNIYYIMDNDAENNNYVIAKYALYNNSDVIIWCINSKTIGEIYTDMLLNGVCFSGWGLL